MTPISINSLLPIIGSVLLAVGMVADKIVLSKKRVAVRDYLPATFCLLSIIPFLLVLFRPEERLLQPLSPYTAGLLMLDIILALTWNIAYYRAMQTSSLGELELTTLSVPLLAPAIAYAVYPAERIPLKLALAAVAALAVIWAHVGRKRDGALKFKPEHGIILFAWAAEILIWPLVLDAFSPALFYFVRVGIIALVGALIFKPRFDELTDKGAWRLALVSGLSGGAAMVCVITGVGTVGLTATMAAVAMSPVIVFVAEATVLREKLPMRLYLASAIVVIAALMAQVI